VEGPWVCGSVALWGFYAWWVAGGAPRGFHGMWVGSWGKRTEMSDIGDMIGAGLNMSAVNVLDRAKNRGTQGG